MTLSTDQARRLLEAAAAVLPNAYAPYSNYRVGAAILTEQGTISTGCNVENASYGLTNCAERTAVFSAVRDGCKRVLAVAVVTAGESVPYPCGACRQVLSEFSEPDCPVLIARTAELDAPECTTMGELLPRAFVLREE